MGERHLKIEVCIATKYAVGIKNTRNLKMWSIGTCKNSKFN